MLLGVVAFWGLGHDLGLGQFSVSKVIVTVGVLALLGTLQVGGVRTKGICLLTVCVCSLMLVIICGSEMVVEFIHFYVNWLLQAQDWNMEWEEGYRLLQVLWVTLFCYVLQIVMEKISVLQIVLAVSMCGALVYGMLARIDVVQIAVAAIMGYVLLTYVEHTQKHWKKEKEQDSKIFIVWTLPFYLVFVLILMVTPVSEEPYDWKFAKQIYAHMKESFTVWYEDVTRNDQEDFGLATSGFSEDGRLMSGLIPDNQELMTIQGNRSLTTNVYLIGKVYDTFLGQEWIQTQETTQKERFLDAMETLYTVTRFEQEIPENYIEDAKLWIRYEHFDTGYVFAPLKAWQIEGIDYETKGADMVLAEKVGYATEYATMYYQMNIDHPAFYELIEKDAKQDEELWNLLMRKYVLKSEHRYKLEELQEQREKIYQAYSQDLQLSKEVEAYLKKVTETSETPIQKLRAIERELNAYTYTLTPGKLPDTVSSAESFLDYFLLESQKGYCSYYATAFVLLARAEGFPARYVEGFCVPMNTDKKMTVYSNMAHAWPEVYIDGIGWIPFEPTPGYEEIRYTPWKHMTKEEVQSGVEKEYYEDEDWFEISEYETTPKIQDEEVQEGNGIVLPIILTAVGAIVLGSILTFTIERIYRRKRQQHMTAEDTFLLILKNMFWMMGKLGLVREQTQTLQEFHENSIVPFLEQEEVGMTLLQSIGWYEDYLYGQKLITDEMLKQAQEEKLMLLEILSKRKKLVFYFIKIMNL